MHLRLPTWLRLGIKIAGHGILGTENYAASPVFYNSETAFFIVWFLGKEKDEKEYIPEEFNTDIR